MQSDAELQETGMDVDAPAFGKGRSLETMSVRRLCKRLLFAAVVVGTLIALAYASISFWGRHEWAQAQLEIRARGESLNREDFIPPPIADEDNFYASPMWVELTDLVERPGQDGGPPSQEPRVAKDKLRVAAFMSAMQGKRGSAISAARKGSTAYSSPLNLDWLARYYRENGFPVSASSGSAETVLSVLDLAKEERAELLSDASRPDARLLRIPGPFTVGSNLLMPPFEYFIIIAQYLNLRVAAEAELGMGEQAKTDVLLILRLADSLKTEPFLISQVIRTSIVTVSATALWEGLDRRCWNEAELARLAQAFASVSVRVPVIRALRNERAMFVWTIEPYARVGGASALLRKIMGDQFPEDMSLPLSLYPTGLLFDDMAAYVRFSQRAIDAMEDPVNSLSRSKKIEEELDRSRKAFHLPIRIFSQLSQPSFNGISKKLLETETRARQAQIACALEIHHLHVGTYPEELNDLPGLPVDPVNNQPFHYRKKADGGYLLWSVAYNNADDGGYGMQGDWVWSMPGNRPSSSPAP
jgi:hypothetical protein